MEGRGRNGERKDGRKEEKGRGKMKDGIRERKWRKGGGRERKGWDYHDGRGREGNYRRHFEGRIYYKSYRVSVWQGRRQN